MNIRCSALQCLFLCLLQCVINASFAATLLDLPAVELAPAEEVDLGTSHAHPLYRGANGTLDLNLEVTASPFYSSFDYAGADETSVKWIESYFRGGLSGTMRGLGGTVYGGVGIISSKLFGDGDAAGTSTGHEYRTDFDSAYAGWKNNWLDLSAGRQKYLMGDAFLIAGDQFNFGERIGNGFNRGGLYYLAGRASFANTGIVRVLPLKGLSVEGFHLESNNNGQGSPHLDGVNSEYSPAPGNTLGAAWFQVNNVDTERAGGLFALRKDLDVYNLRGTTNLGLTPLSIAGGYAAERSSDVDAYAWYASIDYQFADVPLAPQIGYRYSRFSGDDPSTSKSETFDPLFYGSTLGNPAWVQGEVAGNFAGPFNSNARVSRISLQTIINDKLAISAMAYRFDSERDSEHLADELDLYFQTAPTPNLLFIPIIGLWKPRQGAEAVYGVTDTQTFVAFVTSFTY
ncbi:alginate export family protein [Pseudomonas sp. NPDC089569]|uniref:alginate export family protein n=1 Tax=Pseudomonas sp. NPDC089569 TaxID=3390722 RepID=UPI003CFCC2F4